MKRIAVALVFFFLQQQAGAALFSDDEAHKKIDVLKQENQQLRDQIKTLEERTNKLDAAMRSQGLLELLQQIEQLKNELAKLRGQVELNTHQLGSIDARQKDLYVDLDTRLRKYERAGTAAPDAAPTPGGATSPSPTGAGASGDAAAEPRAYDAAFNLFKIGNYQAAIAGFQNFLKTYPKSPLAANAQYWVGNSYSALRDFKNCAASQQKLVSAYPESPKVPDAMLNLASCQLEAGDRESAKKTLDDVVAKHPGSSAADSAKKRLANLR